VCALVLGWGGAWEAHGVHQGVGVCTCGCACAWVGVLGKGECRVGWRIIALGCAVLFSHLWCCSGRALAQAVVLDPVSSLANASCSAARSHMSALPPMLMQTHFKHHLNCVEIGATGC
jgi:hypothetical protein